MQRVAVLRASRLHHCLQRKVGIVDNIHDTNILEQPVVRNILNELGQGLGEHHDIVLGITSHLPHLIAYNIVATAADLEEVTQSEIIKFSAGGFRDFTRIAASDPVMWRDVFLNNREAVLELLGRFSEDLSVLQRAIRWGKGDELIDLFTRSRDVRSNIVEAGQDTATPNFGRRN